MTQLISKTKPMSGGIIHTLNIIVSWEKRFMSPLMSGIDLHRHREFVDTLDPSESSRMQQNAELHTGVMKTRQK